MKKYSFLILTAVLLTVAFLTACGSAQAPDDILQGDSSITTVTIQGNAETIEVSAYEGCTNLKTVKIQNGVKTIKSHAFKDCVSLEEIYLPKTITTIEFQAFKNCRHLKTIYYGGSESDWASVTIKGGNNYLRGVKNIYFNQTGF